MIGLYGTIFFQSGTTGLTTFNELKKTVTARWGDHPVHLDKPLLEYAGPQLIEITFRMELIKPVTADPLGTIVMLEEIMDLAIPLPLVIGMKPMGRGFSLFVLSSLSHEMKYFYRGGGLMGASVEVQLKEYPASLQNILSSLQRALGGVFGGPGGGTTTPTGQVSVGELQPTDANAGALPTDMTGAENQGFEASEYPSYTGGATGLTPGPGDFSGTPQIAQNAVGNPVAANLAPDGMPAGLPDPSGLPTNEDGAAVVRIIQAKEAAAGQTVENPIGP